MKTNKIGSIVFSIIFPIYTIAICSLSIFLFLAPQTIYYKLITLWGKSTLWLLKKLTNLEVKIIGKIPESGIIAAQHQSTLEIIAICAYFKNPSFLYKSTLRFIPFLGLALIKIGMIAVHQRKKNKNWRKQAKTELSKNKSIIIFPEGTRVAYNKKVDFKYGVFKLAQETNMKIIPVATNAGKYWPRKSIYKTSGIAKLVIGAPIDPTPENLRKSFDELIT